MALATSALPVPVSPWIRTVESVRATMCNESHTFRSPRLEPMSSLWAAHESKRMMLIALVTMCLLQVTTYRSSFLCPGMHFDAWHSLQGRVKRLFDFADREIQ